MVYSCAAVLFVLYRDGAGGCYYCSNTHAAAAAEKKMWISYIVRYFWVCMYVCKWVFVYIEHRVFYPQWKRACVLNHPHTKPAIKVTEYFHSLHIYFIIRYRTDPGAYPNSIFLIRINIIQMSIMLLFIQLLLQQFRWRRGGQLLFSWISIFSTLLLPFTVTALPL